MRGTSRILSLCWEPIPPDTLELAQDLLLTGGLSSAEVLKAQRVWRVGACVLKYYPIRRWRDRWRTPASVRAARASQRLSTLGGPRALAALWQRSAGGIEASVLISEFVAGQDLAAVLATSPAQADCAFPLYLAALHKQRHYHGDVHPWQFLWDGTRWYSLDLESMRHSWRALWRRRLERDAWARLHYYALRFVSAAAGARLAELYPAYDAARYPASPHASAGCARRWRAIEAASAALMRQRQGRAAKPQKSLQQEPEVR